MLLSAGKRLSLIVKHHAMNQECRN